ncbi:Uncharacterised protein [Acinetobacter baumannii]|nr:Uncharacterised protein [Acinetobacter baumannii]
MFSIIFSYVAYRFMRVRKCTIFAVWCFPCISCLKLPPLLRVMGVWRKNSSLFLFFSIGDITSCLHKTRELSNSDFSLINPETFNFPLFFSKVKFIWISFFRTKIKMPIWNEYHACGCIFKPVCRKSCIALTLFDGTQSSRLNGMLW